MKMRGLLAIDFEVDDLTETADIAQALKDAEERLTRQFGRGVVKWSETAIRPRRGDTRPDLKTAKFRA